MLKHIVCWKYKPETTDEQRTDHVAKLCSLTTTVPGIESFAVGLDVLRLERSFDTGLIAEFADRAALDAYSDHPDHLAVAAFGKQIAEKVVSVDFITD